MTDQTDYLFAEELQQARTAIATLARLDNHGELPELISDQLPARVFAQILMNHLPLNHLEMEDKVFWLTVVEYMGGDYLAAMRKVGGFMNKVNEF